MELMWQLRDFAPQITKFLYPLVILVLGLLLRFTICVFVRDWIIYYFLVRKNLSEPVPGGLKVIICGFPRSGTMTLKNAMDILGFPCLHGSNLVKPGQIRLFMKARKSGKREDWDCLLKGYTSISDFPATTCYKNLMELYPDAKVILNIRDASKWYKSFAETILKVPQLLQVHFLIHTCAEEVFFKDMLKGKEKDMEFAMHMYNMHIKEVKAYVRPQRRLLVYEFEDNTRGWAPLCEFLEVEAPLVPFPHSNDSQAFKKTFLNAKTIHNIVGAAYFTFLALIVFFITKLFG